MKVLIILSCLAAVCLTLPSKRQVTGNVAKTIQTTADILTKKEVQKRASSFVQGVFNLMDSNKDGHMTSSEYATFHANDIDFYGMTMEEWISVFNEALKEVDSNQNGTLEINEYDKMSGGLIG